MVGIWSEKVGIWSEKVRIWSESVGILKVINKFSFVFNPTPTGRIGRNWSESMVGNVGCTYGGGHKGCVNMVECVNELLVMSVFLPLKVW